MSETLVCPECKGVIDARTWAACRTCHGSGRVWAEPTYDRGVVQPAEQDAHNVHVAGSSPAPATTIQDDPPW